MADEQQGPRETAAGLQHGDEDPSAPARGGGGVDPATQHGMIDQSSTPDEQSTRAKAQRDDKVTAENWNQ